jgi:hypothetical protein
MPAGEYNITVDRGSTFKFHVTFFNSSEVAVDLNTYSASMQVRKSTPPRISFSLQLVVPETVTRVLSVVVLLVTLRELVVLQVSAGLS